MSVPKKINKVEIRMYKLGTGDCFGLKFYNNNELSFKLMIDCGTWQGSKAHLTPYISDLMTWFDGNVDLLIITHEHKDHVYGFEACEALFAQGFEAKETWMAWTENDNDPNIQDWMKKYGQKKKALALATERINNFVNDEINNYDYEHEFHYHNFIDSRKRFASKLSDLVDLQFSKEIGMYAGNLKGMKIVKEKIAKGNLVFKEPGDIINALEGLPGVNIYILGPPKSWAAIKKENGGSGQSYRHNTEIFKSDAFANAVLKDSDIAEEIFPFDEKYIIHEKSEIWDSLKRYYKNGDNDWRNIEFDWLSSAAGDLALRVNSMTNNLSLVLAIEFEDTKKVMLFPGDAEFGSWESWHEIPWPAHLEVESKQKKTFAEDLLNRTIFYKVAHHLSHNGTAKKLGLEMMNSPELVAMATLDYNVISDGWKSTMPNVEIIKELIKRTRGRLMVMNETDLLADRKTAETLTEFIEKGKKTLSPIEKESFDKNYKSEDLYLEYTLNI